MFLPSLVRWKRETFRDKIKTWDVTETVNVKREFLAVDFSLQKILKAEHIDSSFV